jgi:YD repeat-containing protein
MVDPSLNTTRYTFSNQADATEGKPLKTEYFQGDTSGTLLRTEAFSYAPFNQGPWPTVYGGGFNVMANLDRQEGEAPQLQKTVTEEGDTYTWQALAFDTYARPSLTHRSSSFGFSVDEKQDYLDDTARSVIGLPTVYTNLIRNEVVSETTYDPAALTPQLRKHFGQTLMTYSFNPQGQLATFQDANANTTHLDNYKLGIPQTITFPDINTLHPNGTVETVAVDDFGQIASITDQAGSTTLYAYDGVGRVLRIDYPAGDAPSLAPKTFAYTFSPDARDLGGNHWVREVTQDIQYERTDFDAMLRPVAAGKGQVGTVDRFVSTRTDFDWRGHKTFASYAVEGDVGRAAMGVGITTSYDALGRARTESQPSAQGTLVTSTDYLSGGVRRVTDPKGDTVSAAYQAFDEPSYEKPVRVDAGAGAALVTQTIDRDVYGNPNSITQGGLSKTYTYDSQYRVCRLYEKETGSAISAFDAVGNVVWSASGQAFNDLGCGYDQILASDKVIRAYDTMNRVTQVTYPGVGPTLTYTYDLLGNPATAVSDTASAKPTNKGAVGWAFGRNKMGVVTAELLSVDSWSWTVGYTYDENGNLASTQYPDGKSVPYSPNALGQPTSAGLYLTGATYYPDGQVAGYTLGNGVPYTAHRNERNLLSDFAYGMPGAAPVSEGYFYDPAGNITAISDAVGTGQRARTFTYDELNRLTGASSPGLWGNETYRYDALNNIQSVTNSGGVSTYNYNGLNQLATISVNGSPIHSYTYDNRGNVTLRDSQALAFDVANRVLSVGTLGDYMYDAAGRRVKAVSPTGTTYYAYNAAGQLLWQYDPATNAGTDYVYLGGKLVASTNNVAAPALAPSLTAPASAQANVAYTVSWTAVASTTSYELQEQPDGGAWTSIAFSAALSRQITHAAAGTFHYQVRACNTGGCGAWSAPATTVVAPPPTAPIAPASVSASLAGNLSAITVTWSSSPTATSYNVQQAINGGAWADIYSGTGTTASVANPGDGNFAYQARACNPTGCSAWTASAAVHVAHIPPAPGSISVPGTSTGVLGISWPGVAYATSYSLEQSTDNANYGAVYNGAATSASIGVGATGVYYYRVRGCNANGCGPYSPVGASSVTIAPSQAPAISGPGSSNNGCYTINWGGVPGATSYVMQENTNGAGWVTIGNNGSGALGICGKGNGTYYYQVQGCNAAGCGPFSGVVAVTVALIPALPTGIQMTDTVSGRQERITILWNATSNATRYEILRVQTNIIINAGTATSYVVESGPSPYDLKYTYRVRACNDQGCSIWSGDIAG